MQIHLKGLTKSEWTSLMSVVNWVLKSMGEPRDFEEFQTWDALRDLLMDMMRRVPELKGRMNITLKEGAATALFRHTDALALPPYEQSLMLRVLEQMDIQWMSRMALLKGNMSAGFARQGEGER